MQPDNPIYKRPIGSMFQTDTIGLRLRWPITWALRASNAIAFMQSVDW